MSKIVDLKSGKAVDSNSFERVERNANPRHYLYSPLEVLIIKKIDTGSDSASSDPGSERR